MRIYFAGIGGSGIGPLAEVALSAGYDVVGSDAAASEYTSALKATGVDVSFDQSGDFLRACHELAPIDVVVYSAALSSSHPELLAAEQLGIPHRKRDSIVNEIIQRHGLRLLAVAGTHGKTTTSAMLVWAMRSAGIAVSYLIGSRLQFGPSGQFDPASQYFIYECDEFDRNFLQFEPTLSLITSIDYDHPDVYATKEDYAAAFTQFIGKSEHSVLYQTDAEKVLAATTPENICIIDTVDPRLTLAGAHNRRNAQLAASSLAISGLISETDAMSALNRFPGAKRRFETIVPGLYSDYGHHPAEIAATLQLARELNDRVVLVYQPHQNVRQHEIKDDYIDCFTKAKTVYWLPTHLSREDPALNILEFSDLTKNISAPSDIHPAKLDEALRRSIERELASGGLVLCMGAGSIDSWVRHTFIREQL